MDWIVLSLLALLIGMAGFWGGVLQHSHVGAGDGGSLLAYPRIVSADNTIVEIAGSVAPTELWSFVLPANTLTTSTVVMVELGGDWLNNGITISPNSPQFHLRLSGSSTLMLNPTVAALPKQAARHGWVLQFSVAIFNTNPQIESIGPGNLQILRNTGGVILVDQWQAQTYVGLDWTTNKTLALEVTNANADADYRTRKIWARVIVE